MSGLEYAGIASSAIPFLRLHTVIVEPWPAAQVAEVGIAVAAAPGVDWPSAFKTGQFC